MKRWAILEITAKKSNLMEIPRVKALLKRRLWLKIGPSTWCIGEKKRGLLMIRPSPNQREQQATHRSK